MYMNSIKSHSMYYFISLRTMFLRSALVRCLFNPLSLTAAESSLE